MYVCICSALNEKKVRAALDAGARSPAAVLKHHGEKLQCGKCVGMIREMASACSGSCGSCAQTGPSPAANDDGDLQAAWGVAAE